MNIPIVNPKKTERQITKRISLKYEKNIAYDREEYCIR